MSRQPIESRFLRRGRRSGRRRLRLAEDEDDRSVLCLRNIKSNPYGIQMDDVNFDMLWYSEGKITKDGYTDNYENVRLDPQVSPLLQWTSFPDTSAGRQIFVKLSYMFRM